MSRRPVCTLEACKDLRERMETETAVPEVEVGRAVAPGLLWAHGERLCTGLTLEASLLHAGLAAHT